jgi:hypothetical protein
MTGTRQNEQDQTLRLVTGITRAGWDAEQRYNPDALKFQMIVRSAPRAAPALAAVIVLPDRSRVENEATGTSNHG